ncbi:hypothetical protein OZX74_08915 [Bifidobacterium sp. ESL0798]|uniref:hypothetical protein n=1 Tax=Bifidobacterium sp. ESL0798 TaxID=2983235 RepID=UPI0023F67F56|nr:hypothetical protein [Bifidobacterium sp. ESL0798]WEV73981.1 hypothetical protein OZX74_08915 [Bifidobacterium sp. ESL0798]
MNEEEPADEVDRQLEADGKRLDDLRRERQACDKAWDEMQSACNRHHDIWMGLSEGLRGSQAYARFGAIEDEFRASAGGLMNRIEQEADDRDAESRRIRTCDEDLQGQRRVLAARRGGTTDTRGERPWG